MTEYTPLERVLLEQVRYLKRVAAFEARIIEAQTLDLKSLSKGRREVLEESVVALRHVALDEPTDRYSYPGSFKELERLQRESQ